MESKYKTYAEWRDNNQNAYQHACMRGLLDIICVKFGWDRNPNNRKASGYWTKQRCIDEANKYKTIKEWKLNSATTYEKAKWKKFLDECTTHMVEDVKEPRKPAGYWNIRKNCVNESLKYDNTFNWYRYSPISLRASVKNNWFSFCTKHMKERTKPFQSCFTKKECLDAASKYSSLQNWKKGYIKSYNAAVEHGWIKYITKKLWK
jgi:hypothetical protein